MYKWILEMGLLSSSSSRFRPSHEHKVFARITLVSPWERFCTASSMLHDPVPWRLSLPLLPPHDKSAIQQHKLVSDNNFPTISEDFNIPLIVQEWHEEFHKDASIQTDADSCDSDKNRQAVLFPKSNRQAVEESTLLRHGSPLTFSRDHNLTRLGYILYAKV